MNGSLMSSLEIRESGGKMSAPHELGRLPRVDVCCPRCPLSAFGRVDICCAARFGDPTILAIFHHSSQRESSPYGYFLAFVLTCHRGEQRQRRSLYNWIDRCITLIEALVLALEMCKQNPELVKQMLHRPMLAVIS